MCCLQLKFLTHKNFQLHYVSQMVLFLLYLYTYTSSVVVLHSTFCWVTNLFNIKYLAILLKTECYVNTLCNLSSSKHIHSHVHLFCGSSIIIYHRVLNTIQPKLCDCIISYICRNIIHGKKNRKKKNNF